MAFDELMMAGGELLVLGMGIVFGFLVLLVFALQGMSWVALRLAGEPEPAAATAPPRRPPPQHPAEPARLVAVIAAAVRRYRSDHPR